MHENAKFVCFIYMQPQKVKFKSVQINMKHVSYFGNSQFRRNGIFNFIIFEINVFDKR